MLESVENLGEFINLRRRVCLLEPGSVMAMKRFANFGSALFLLYVRKNDCL